MASRLLAACVAGCLLVLVACDAGGAAGSGAARSSSFTHYQVNKVVRVGCHPDGSSASFAVLVTVRGYSGVPLAAGAYVANDPDVFGSVSFTPKTASWQGRVDLAAVGGTTSLPAGQLSAHVGLGTADMKSHLASQTEPITIPAAAPSACG